MKRFVCVIMDGIQDGRIHSFSNFCYIFSRSRKIITFSKIVFPCSEVVFFIFFHLGLHKTSGCRLRLWHNYCLQMAEHSIAHCKVFLVLMHYFHSFMLEVRGLHQSPAMRVCAICSLCVTLHYSRLR